MYSKAFCILAAGRGSRLGELTSSINKGLLPIKNKAAISHIIDKVPDDCEIVIAVGYDKEKVVEYCEAAHPGREFVFVEVDRLEGPGSGPGYSLMVCWEHLQRPFYVCNIDTIVSEETYPDLSVDWMGVCHTEDARPFSTITTEPTSNLFDHKKFAIKVCNKGEVDRGWAYIGLMGIHDWQRFWKLLLDSSLSMAGREFQYEDAFRPIDMAHYIECKQFDWLDTGSTEGYNQTCMWYGGAQSLGMQKNINEITYKVNGRVVKLSFDSMKNLKRVKRASVLSPHTPDIIYSGKYVMAYIWMEGSTLYYNKDLGIWENFLNWCSSNLWNKYYAVDRWEEICYSFYFDKTWERLRLYQQSKGWEQSPSLRINGHQCEPIESYLTCLDWDWLCRGSATKIHGDLQFDNVILTDTAVFKLIDWRECFGDSDDYGDVYYDLAKIYSGLDLPYDILKRKEIQLTWNGMFPSYEIGLNSTIASFRINYEHWLKERGFDTRKVQTLSALIHLNMAPLHPHAIGDILFLHSNLRLSQLCKGIL